MRLITTAAMCMALLLAGCGSDEPTPKEPKATSSPTAATEPPEMPEQAKEDSDEGAAAFVTYYVDLLNFAARTGETTTLSALTAAECSGCDAYIDLYRNTYAAGDAYSGGEWTLGPTVLLDYGAETLVTADVAIAAGTFSSATSEESTQSPAESVRTTFGAAWIGGAWVMRQMFLGDPS